MNSDQQEYLDYVITLATCSKTDAVMMELAFLLSNAYNQKKGTVNVSDLTDILKKNQVKKGK